MKSGRTFPSTPDQLRHLLEVLEAAANSPSEPARGRVRRTGNAAGGAPQQRDANRIRNMGRGSGTKSKAGGTTKARKTKGPSFGPGPGGLGESGTGAPWG